tara:strand:- start:149 stop:583 length:435 start_codon:yes stop_codon:yes gene_type:complete
MWKIIKEKMNNHQYMSGVNRSSERVKNSGEIFTPTDLVLDMFSRCDLDIFSPKKTVLDPACGDGQFLYAVYLIKTIHFDMSSEDALDDIYGVDIMRDNVDLCKKRLCGGTIIMGDTLNPSKHLEDQTEEERIKMIDLFSETVSL